MHEELRLCVLWPVVSWVVLGISASHIMNWSTTQSTHLSLYSSHALVSASIESQSSCACVHVLFDRYVSINVCACGTRVHPHSPLPRERLTYNHAKFCEYTHVCMRARVLGSCVCQRVYTPHTRHSRASTRKCDHAYMLAMRLIDC